MLLVIIILIDVGVCIVLTKLLLCATILINNVLGVYVVDNQLKDIISQTSKINIYIDGEMNSYDNSNNVYYDIIKEYTDMSSLGREMPALGVAIHSETINAIGSGVWLEFIFDCEMIYNEMPFDRLLIEVNRDYKGYNIIRHYNGEYSGRCFYVDLLDEDMSKLYEYLIAIE